MSKRTMQSIMYSALWLTSTIAIICALCITEDIHCLWFMLMPALCSLDILKVEGGNIK